MCYRYDTRETFVLLQGGAITLIKPPLMAGGPCCKGISSCFCLESRCACPLDDEVPCMCGTCFLMCYHGKQCNPTFMVDAPRVKMHTHSGKMESGKPPPASPPGCLDAASSDPEPAVDQSCSAHAPFVFTCAACSDWISNGSRRRPARNGDGPLSAMKPSDRQGASTARTRLLAEAR